MRSSARESAAGHRLLRPSPAQRGADHERARSPGQGSAGAHAGGPVEARPGPLRRRRGGRGAGAPARIGPESVVLDLCSGLGGPARFLAWRFGCRVTGVDLTASRCRTAERLTELVGLGHTVRFVHADATALPFEAESFTACIGQESFVHIADKDALFGECRRVLIPGGRLVFTDWIATERLG